MMRRALYLGVGLFFTLFLVLPVGAVFVRAFSGTEAATLMQTLREVLSSRATHRIVGFTFGQALLSAAAGTLLAFPVAYMVSHYRFRGSRFFYSLSLVPFVLPSIIVVVCMISFYGRNGLVNALLGTEANLIYSFGGIILAHIFYDFSLAIRVIANGWQSIDHRHREASESLGDKSIGTFVRVTLPLLAPSIVTGFLLIFIYTFLSFGVILVFGGVQFATLEVAIYQETFIRLDLAAAAIYALLQLVFSVAFLALTGSSLRAPRGATPGTQRPLPPLSSAAPVRRWCFRIYGVLIVVFVLGPILTMVARAFGSLSGFPSLAGFQELFAPQAGQRNVESILRSSVGGVIGRSIALALASGTLAVVVAGALTMSLRGSKRGVWETLVQAPIGVSLVTLSLGLRLFWVGRLPQIVLVIAGQFFVAFPLVFRILRTGIEELPESQLKSALAGGASRMQAFRDVELPQLKRSFLNAYAYALALPFADLTVVLAAGQSTIATFPVAIYRLIGFRSFDLALALSVIYIALCFGLFVVIDSTSSSRSIRW